ncbi:hypothetical protein HispidOSU_025379 [Sigmodon hispidus]
MSFPRQQGALFLQNCSSQPEIVVQITALQCLEMFNYLESSFLRCPLQVGNAGPRLHRCPRCGQSWSESPAGLELQFQPGLYSDQAEGKLLFLQEGPFSEWSIPNYGIWDFSGPDSGQKRAREDCSGTLGVRFGCSLLHRARRGPRGVFRGFFQKSPRTLGSLQDIQQPHFGGFVTEGLTAGWSTSQPLGHLEFQGSDLNSPLPQEAALRWSGFCQDSQLLSLHAHRHTYVDLLLDTNQWDATPSTNATHASSPDSEVPVPQLLSKLSPILKRVGDWSFGMETPGVLSSGKGTPLLLISPATALFVELHIPGSVQVLTGSGSDSEREPGAKLTRPGAGLPGCGALPPLRRLESLWLETFQDSSSPGVPVGSRVSSSSSPAHRASETRSAVGPPAEQDQ